MIEEFLFVGWAGGGRGLVLENMAVIYTLVRRVKGVAWSEGWNGSSRHGRKTGVSQTGQTQ